MIDTETVHGYARIRFANGITNPLTTDVLQALLDALSEAQANARGVLLCGGEKFFSNGVDLDWALARSSDEMRTMFATLGECVLGIMESRVPVVGVARGHAVGGAFALLIACDYRFAADGRTLLGKPEIKLGVPNPYFGDQLLRFVADDFVASDLIYSGRLITGEEARAAHIVHGVADEQAIENLAWAQLQVLAGLAPEAFAETKRMRNGAFCARVREQMPVRVARQVEIWNTEEAQSRLREAASRLAH